MKLLKAMIKTYKEAERIIQLLVKWLISMIPFFIVVPLSIKNPNSSLILWASLFVILMFFKYLVNLFWLMIKGEVMEVIDKIKNNMEE